MKKVITQIKRMFRPRFKQNKPINFSAFDMSTGFESNGLANMKVWSINHKKMKVIQLFTHSMDSNIKVATLVLEKESAIELIRQLKIEVKKLNK